MFNNQSLNFEEWSGHHSMMGNNNRVFFSNSHATLQLTGNNNFIQVSGSTLRITIAGNNNVLQCTRGSNASLNLTGNNNVVESDDSRVQIRNVTGLNNILPGGEQDRPRDRQRVRHVPRRDRPEFQVYPGLQRLPSGYHEEPMRVNREEMPAYRGPVRSGRPRRHPSQVNHQPISRIVQQPEGLSLLFETMGRMMMNSVNFGMPNVSGIRIPSSQPAQHRQNVIVVDDSDEQEQPGLGHHQLSMLPKSKNTGRVSNCTVCLEDIRRGEYETYLFCFHSFHTECIQKWLVRNNQCPVCQLNVKEHIAQG